MLTGDARCQKDECAKVMVKRELAAEKRAHRETKDELENLRATVRLQIEGGVRKWDAEHGVDLRSDLETKTRETRESRDRRNTAEKKARELAEDLADLYGIKADLLRQLSDLKTMSEKKDIAHRYELRALGREMREAQVTAVAETLGEAEEKLAEAEERRDAEAPAVEAVAAEMEVAVALARRVADAAKEEALELSADLTEAEKEVDNLLQPGVAALSS